MLNNLRRIACSFILLASVANAADYQLEVITDKLNYPWSVAPLDDGSFLVTERGGRLLQIGADGSISPVGNVPATYVAGQGGFFDVLPDPDFATNQMLYLSYARGTPEANGTAVEQAKLVDSQLTARELILQVEHLKDTPQHYGGRMLLLPDGTLLVATGEGFEYRESAQDLNSELGKVLRINTDGSIPVDNPMRQHQASRRIFTYGHRNTQGLALDANTGTVYLHEHGPRGGDELNVLQPGLNYGWPAITYGVDYSGAYVSPLNAWPGMEQPLAFWVPSIAPSGMAWYGGDLFPQWRGDLFLSTLVDKDVRRLDMRDGEVIAQESLFHELDERIRDVRSGKDGALYLLTDSEQGQLIRVVPAK